MDWFLGDAAICLGLVVAGAVAAWAARAVRVALVGVVLLVVGVVVVLEAGTQIGVQWPVEVPDVAPVREPDLPACLGYDCPGG